MAAPPTIAELEALEAVVWRDLFKAAPPPLAAGAGMDHQIFGDITAFAIRAAPTVQFNYAHGPSLNTLVGEELDRLLAWMAGHCSPAWMVQVIDDREHPRLKAHGLEPTGSWTKFVRATSEPPAAACDLRIEAVGPERAEVFGATAQAGYGVPPSFRPWLAAIPGRPGWTTYIAYDGDAPAAAAALYIKDGLAWLGVGSCLAEFRRRGAQSALLARRLGDAARAGCAFASTETGTPSPGDAANHPSFRNIGRAGFRPIYERVNWRTAGQLS